MKHARDDYARIQDPDGKIPDDEPVFLLRGQDVAAPATLEAYTKELARFGADHDMIEAVKRHAEDMLDWQTSRACKVPDIP